MITLLKKCCHFTSSQRLYFVENEVKKRKNWERVRNSGKMGGPNIKGSKMGKIEKIRSSSALPFFKSTLQTKYFGGLT